MIKVWLISFALLFVLAELVQWVKGFLLPLPIYMVAGAFLAIASNYDKGMFALLQPPSPPANPDIITQTAELIDD